MEVNLYTYIIKLIKAFVTKVPCCLTKVIIFNILKYRVVAAIKSAAKTASQDANANAE